MKDQNSERGFAVAAIIQAIPPAFSFFVVGWLSLFMLVAAILNWAQLPVFFSHALWWCGFLLIIVGVLGFAAIIIWGYNQYHNIMIKVYERRTARWQSEIAFHKVEMYKQLPAGWKYAIDSGRNVSYGGLKVTDWRSNMTHQSAIGEQVQPLQLPLPTQIRYEDVRHQIPEGHNLVGVGIDGLVTKEDRKIGACVWIVGLSGTGKTSTTSLRIEERANCEHQFLGHDPHWFKDDSLTNAIVGYADRFLMPMARSNDEALLVYEAFLSEFNNRKAGKVAKPFQKITIVVDEVNSLAEPDDEDEQGKKLLDKLKTIVRICGTEARNFNMGGLFISQKATRLYWIRDVALLIIVHKLLMENQQKLATNIDDKAFFAEMRLWPVGRTYVYGAGLEAGEGCITVQQPYFEKASVGSWNFEDRVIVEEEPVSNDLDRIYEACQSLKDQGLRVTARSVAPLTPFGKTKVSELLNKLKEQGVDVF